MFLILMQGLPAQTIQTYVEFDQSAASKSYVQIPDNANFSESTTGSLTVASWIKPDTLDFKYVEGNGYVHWLGKGDYLGKNHEEWMFRMYNSSNDQNRVNRISFYVFNLTGGEGIGSYFQYPTNTQEPVRADEWIFVVGVVNGATNTTSIYKDGAFIRCDKYYGDSIVSIQGKACQHYPRYDQLGKARWIVPKHGNAPLTIGRADADSYFQGGIARVRIWNRALNSTEIQKLYSSEAVPQQGLVAQYLLNESSGAVVHDSVGGHDGKILGTSWRWIPSPDVAPQTATTFSTRTPSSSANPTGVEVIGISTVVAVIAVVAIVLGLRKRSR